MSEQQYLELFHKFRKMQNTPDEYHQFLKDMRDYDNEQSPAAWAVILMALVLIILGASLYALITPHP